MYFIFISDHLTFSRRYPPKSFAEVYFEIKHNFKYGSTRHAFGPSSYGHNNKRKQLWLIRWETPISVNNSSPSSFTTRFEYDNKNKTFCRLHLVYRRQAQYTFAAIIRWFVIGEWHDENTSSSLTFQQNPINIDFYSTILFRVHFK